MSRGWRLSIHPGDRYGRWLVLRRSSWSTLNANGGKNEVLWECRCECGVERTVRAGNLRKGTSRSCGCLAADRTREYHACKH